MQDERISEEGVYALLQEGGGWVRLDLIAGFNRLRQLSPSEDVEAIRIALADSEVVEISQNGERLRVKHPSQVPGITT